MSEDSDESRRYFQEEMLKLIQASEEKLQAQRAAFEEGMLSLIQANEEKLDAQRAAFEEQLWTQRATFDARLQGVQAASFENVVSNGFAAISEQLAPLRDLTPKRKRQEPADAAKLHGIRKDLERPVWNEDPIFEEYSWTIAIPRGKALAP